MITACIREQRFQLKELTIVPRLVPDRPPHNIWKADLVGKTVILTGSVFRKREGERGYRRALIAQADAAFGPARQAIRTAAALNKNLSSVRSDWLTIQTHIHGGNYEAAMYNDVGLVLAFLAQVEVYFADNSIHRPFTQGELQRRLDALLASPSALHWAPLIELVATLAHYVYQAFAPANVARLNGLLTQREAARPFLRWHGGMLAVLYPWLAFRLLAKAPKFGSSLRGPKRIA